MSFFCSKSQSGHHIVLISSILLVTSNLWQFLSLSLFLIILTILQSLGQVLCRMSLTLGLSDVFSSSPWSYWWGKITSEVKCSYCIISLYMISMRLITSDTNLDYLLQVGSAKFSTVKLLVFLLTLSWGHLTTKPLHTTLSLRVYFHKIQTLKKSCVIIFTHYILTSTLYRCWII